MVFILYFAESRMDKKKICFITAAPITATAFLTSHMEALGKSYSVHYVCNARADAVASVPCDEFHNVAIERGISIISDIKALIKLYKYFSARKFDAVHSVTPKAGLLTAIAGWLASVPVRIHIFTGQVWATKKGFPRWLLKSLDKIIVRLDTHILVDGKSQRAFLEKEGILKPGCATVFGDGSISGVDCNKFAPDPDLRRRHREELGIGKDTLVYLFIGRLTRDKGIGELLEAYDMLASEAKDVFLLLVGWDEQNYADTFRQYSHICKENFCYYGSVANPAEVMNAGDVCVLPTYREGFGSSVLEAAALGMPAITSDAYGVLDATVEGETALRCRVADVQSLYKCMRYFNNNRQQVIIMGNHSYERVRSCFSSERITNCWVDYYNSLLGD